MSVLLEKRGRVAVITLDRPEKKNAVDRATAEELAACFRSFDDDDACDVAVFCGAGGSFCAGADLKAMDNRVEDDGDGPMGVSRMVLRKPVIAAIDGHAVAGGLELAIWCDLRVVEEDAVLGVFCRRWGVPLIDGGTVRLPRLIGLSRALDLILTGRAVSAQEALAMGLVNRVVPKGQALSSAVALAEQLAALPQECLRNDRMSVFKTHELPLDDAMLVELHFGRKSLAVAAEGVARFVAGAGRHGT